MREDASVPSLWHNDQSKGHSFIQRIACMVGILAGSCLLLSLGLSLWNLVVTQWQHAHNPVAGDFYSVDGRQMHIYCTGTASPTVIMEVAPARPG